MNFATNDMRDQLVKEGTVCLDAIQQINIIEEDSCMDGKFIFLKLSRGGKDLPLKGIAFLDGKWIGKSYEVIEKNSEKVYMFDYSKESDVLGFASIIEIKGEEKICGSMTLPELKNCN